MNHGNGIKEMHSIFNGHFQNIRNIATFITDFQSFAIIAFTMTGITRYIHIWQKVHCNFNHTIALTGLAASTFDVKGEASCCITTCFGFRGLRKQLTNWSEQTCIGRWVRAWRSPNRALVNIHHFI